MTYASVSKLLQTVPAVGSVTTINSAVLSGVLDDADAIINAKIANVYTLPLSGTYPLLETLAADIALYRVITRRLFTDEQAAKSPWPARYKEALDMLNDIASGDLPLVSSSGVALEASTTGGGLLSSSTQDYTPTFGEHAPEDQNIDPNKLDDLTQ